jgi:hypothetical protein
VMIAIRLAAVWFFLITPKPPALFWVAALGTRQCSLTRCDQTKKVRREREPAHGGNPRSPQTSTGANPWRQWFNTSELDQLLEDVGPFFSMPADLARDHLE